MEIVLAGILGLAFGMVFERYHFCMNSAITHVFLFGGTRRLKGLLAAVLVSAVLFNLLIALGVVETATMSLLPTTIFAGVLFGIGMNLAGGCVSGTLFKMGQGYLASWVAFLGVALGAGAVGLTMSFVPGVEITLWQGTTLPIVLDINPFLFAVLVVGVVLVAYWAWRRRKRGAETAKERSGIDGSSPVVGGVLIAILNTMHFVVSDHPLGLVGVMSVPFVVGAFLSARAAGRFQFRRPIRRQAVSSFIGGLLMGASTLMMIGCNITHILGGVPQFGLGGLVATVGIVIGAWLGAKLVTRIARRS
jgi:uncharacterized membrane protein YedE/YeeE